MRDDLFDRPDVKALCEAVAAGDDPTARLVLADRLDELGADWAARRLRGKGPVKLISWRLEQGPSESWTVWLPDTIHYGIYVWLRSAPPASQGSERLAYALARAADRLAARAAPPAS